MELAGLNIKFVPGVGEKRASLLEQEMGIQSYEDMLYYIPYKYIDRTRVYTIRELTSDLPYIQVKAKITNLSSIGVGKQMRMVATAYDGTGELELVWFTGHKYLASQINPDKEYLIFGKPTIFNHKMNIVHPEMDLYETSVKQLVGFQAIYPTTEKMKKSYLTSRLINKIQANIFKAINGRIQETLPAWFIKKYNLIYLHEALYNIHFPENPDMLRKAQYRLKFEELFYIQLNILKLKFNRKAAFQGHLFTTVGDYFNDFYHNHLPFPLTDAQKRVIKEIRSDCGSGKQMNRLLQGDVGSGKTLVAVMCMLIALDNGYQAAIMAPTEILATQHYETISELLKNTSISVGLLTGSTKKKEREIIHEALSDGRLQVLIGTHALLENVVNFKNVGLVVIDEQHRFGVAQRAKLWQKNTIPPHMLVMTATPIPRTLAMTLYGDLDVSVIDELPPGRKPIQTLHRYDNKKAQLYEFLRKEIQKGRQVYVVYPLIEGNEKLDYKDLEAGFETFKEVFPEYKVCMVHGRMKAADKDTEMQKFISGEAQILMATTVIEVGVNVPNASVMVIESAERFGLSQLHQLRGRVGRGAEQSYCILVSSYKLSNDTRKRLEIMVNSTNGFEIAEADLRLRGHGDLEGTRQSGEGIDLKIADLAADGQILQYARDIAQGVLDEDPELLSEQHRILSERLKTLFTRKINWGMIS